MYVFIVNALAGNGKALSTWLKNEGTSITIETDRAIPAIADGEIITSTPLHITVHRDALQLILTT